MLGALSKLRLKTLRAVFEKVGHAAASQFRLVHPHDNLPCQEVIGGNSKGSLVKFCA